MWEASSGEDRNRMAHNLFEHIVFDLDQRHIVDFKLKPWMDQFIVLRAAILEDEAKYGKCEPDKTQSEPIPQYKTAFFLQQLTFPQSANLARLSNKH